MTENSQPRSRRALLLASGAAALAAGAVVADSTDASAANGQPFLLGKANSASAPTSVTSSSASSGLVATSTNAAGTAHGVVGIAKGGYGLLGSSTGYHGAKISTSHKGRHGLVVENTSTEAVSTGVVVHAKHSSTLTGKDAPTVLRALQAGMEATLTELRAHHWPSCAEFAGKRNGLLAHGTANGVIGVAGPHGTGLFGKGSVGIRAIAETDGVAVSAASTGPNSYGLHVSGAKHYLAGNTFINGDLSVTGTVSKQGGSFRIDHPLDPAHKYLSHSFVESPDMKNVYDGIATADASGAATVELPEWFEALNRDFRYQLTPIGKAERQVYVSEEISGNAFSLAGANPGQRVCWQVTGIRKDVWANENRIPVEHDKPADERGRYLYPEGFGSDRRAS